MCKWSESDDVTGEEDEEWLDVEEWEYHGESYLVCRETLVIYNEEGEEIGKWGEGVTEGATIHIRYKQLIKFYTLFV